MEIHNNQQDKAREEVTIYECYTKIDFNGDGILEDMIITVAGDVILRAEPNYMGRHPFFSISPTKEFNCDFISSSLICLTKSTLITFSISKDSD